MFKIHGWGRAPIAQEIATVHAVRKQVGDEMDLMLDPACEYAIFGEALKVGWACHAARFFCMKILIAMAESRSSPIASCAS